MKRKKRKFFKKFLLNLPIYSLSHIRFFVLFVIVFTSFVLNNFKRWRCVQKWSLCKASRPLKVACSIMNSNATNVDQFHEKPNSILFRFEKLFFFFIIIMKRMHKYSFFKRFIRKIVHFLTVFFSTFSYCYEWPRFVCATYRSVVQYWNVNKMPNTIHYHNKDI